MLGKERATKGFQCATTYRVILTPFLSATSTIKNCTLLSMPFPNRLLYVVIAWVTDWTLYEAALQVSVRVSVALAVSFPTDGEAL